MCAAGARLAEPGEFTLRAFLAGRLDLTQAEAVLGVIDAQRPATVRARRLSNWPAAWRRPLDRACATSLLDLLAHLEAGLDFVEEDIEFVTADRAANDDWPTAAAEIGRSPSNSPRETRGDELPRVVLVGAAECRQEQLVQRTDRAARRWFPTNQARRATI